MAQVEVELDMVEEEVLRKLLEMGLFRTPQEALKVALLKYAIDLGSLGDVRERAAARVQDHTEDEKDDNGAGEE